MNKFLFNCFILATFFPPCHLVLNRPQNPGVQNDYGPWRTHNRWNASSDITLKDYGVFKFRKTIELKTKPTAFMFMWLVTIVTNLFVNGKQVSQGPARGDLYFWNYETVDLAPFLKDGRNIIAALVWNEGRRKPEAQISYLTGFILQGATDAEEIVNTNDTWKTVKDESYQPVAVRAPGYYVAGPGELIQMKNHIRGWEKTDYDDSKWVVARVIGPGVKKEFAVNSTGWMLVASPLPQMEMTMQRLTSTRKSVGVKVNNAFPATKTKVTVPANTKATILLDQGFLTNAYPTLVFSAGQDATFRLDIQRDSIFGKMKTSVGFGSLPYRKKIEMRLMERYLLAGPTVLFRTEPSTRNSLH